MIKKRTLLLGVILASASTSSLMAQDAAKPAAPPDLETIIIDTIPDVAPGGDTSAGSYDGINVVEDAPAPPRRPAPIPMDDPHEPPSPNDGNWHPAPAAQSPPVYYDSGCDGGSACDGMWSPRVSKSSGFMSRLGSLFSGIPNLFR